MHNNLISVLKLALCLLHAFAIASKAQAGMSVHNMDNIRHFDSIQDITNYFGKSSLSIKILELKQFKSDHFLFASYPYSGLDTIDLYCYVKYGDQWVLKMLYFHLRPKARGLTVKETADEIVVSCTKEEFVRLTPDKKLNSVER